MRRTVLWVAAILAAVVLGAFIGSSWRDWTAPPRTASPAPEAPVPARPPAAPPEGQPPRDPFLHIEGTTLSAADPAGRRLWDLRAADLSVGNAKQRVVLTRVAGQFYSGGAVRLTFTAPHAVFHVTSRDVEMTGGGGGGTAAG